MCGQGRFASTDRTRPTRVDKQMKTENIQIENKRGIDAGMKKIKCKLRGTRTTRNTVNNAHTPVHTHVTL